MPSEISQDLLDVQLPEYAKTVPGDDKPSFADQAIEDRLSKYAKMGVDSKVRLQLGSIDEKMKEVCYYSVFNVSLLESFKLQ